MRTTTTAASEAQISFSVLLLYTTNDPFIQILDYAYDANDDYHHYHADLQLDIGLTYNSFS